MGRLKKPTALRLVEGTKDRRKVADRKDEPVPLNPLGNPPSRLVAREKEVWDRVGRELPPGMLRGVDEYVVVAFCRAVALGDEAAEKLRASSMLLKTPNGSVQQSPYIGIVNRQAVLIKSLGAELGLSPAARARIAAGGEDGAGDDQAHYFA